MGLFNQAEIRKIINDTVAQIDLNAKEKDIIGVVDDRTDLNEYANRLFKQPQIANDFINVLYNQFIFKNTEQNMFTSAFDYFRKREEMGFGTYESEVQPIFPLKYKIDGFDRVLKFWETPATVQYFAINRSQTFPQTIIRKELRQAFRSYNDFNNYIEKLLLAPRRGNTIIENNCVKEMLNQNIKNGAVRIEKIASLKSETDYKNLAAKIQEYAIAMCSEPTTAFNKYYEVANATGVEKPVKAWTQSDRRDLCLIAPAELLAKIKTYVLAFAFSKEDVDFNFNFIPLSTMNYRIYNEETREFGEEQASPVQLILCDGGFINLTDFFDEEFSDTNSMVGGIQRAIQIDQSYSIRLTRNAVAFVLDGSSEVVEVEPNSFDFSADTDSEEFEFKNADGETVKDYTLTTSIYNTALEPVESDGDLLKLEIQENGTLNISVNEGKTGSYIYIIQVPETDIKILGSVNIE